MLITSSKSQYETRLKNWGFQKNATSDHWRLINNVIEMRELLGKDSEVFLRGKLVKKEKLKKERKRYRAMRAPSNATGK
jgi:hypothetical protein